MSLYLPLAHKYLVSFTKADESNLRHLGNNRGHHEIEFSFDARMYDEDWCWDSAKWCKDMCSKLKIAADTDSVGADANEWADCVVYGEIAKKAVSKAKAAVHAEGRLTVDRAGNAGAVQEITLGTNLDYCTLAVATVETDANLEARVTDMAYTHTSLDDICVEGAYWWYWFPWYVEECAPTSSRAKAVGKAKAESTADATGLAMAGGNGSQSTSVHVKGQNLQKFTALIMAGASNFAITESTSVVSVMTQGYVEAYSTSIAEVCTQFQTNCSSLCLSYYPLDASRCISTCESPTYCADIDARARVKVSAVAKAFAEAVAFAFSRASIMFFANAEFERTPGNDKNGFGGDKITLSGGGLAKADAVVSCN